MAEDFHHAIRALLKPVRVRRVRPRKSSPDDHYGYAGKHSGFRYFRK